MSTFGGALHDAGLGLVALAGVFVVAWLCCVAHDWRRSARR